MGQWMASSHELSHAMKKMKLSNPVTDDANLAEGACVAEVVDACSPYSPYHKEASRYVRLMDIAVNAPFEDGGSMDGSDVPQALDYTGDEQWNGSTNSGAVSPLLNAHVMPSIDYSPGDPPVASISSHNQTVQGSLDTIYCVDISDAELLSFARLCETLKHGAVDGNLSCVENEHRSPCIGGTSFAQIRMFVQPFEPSDEDLLLHFK